MKDQNIPPIEKISDSVIGWYNKNTDPNNRLLIIRVIKKLSEIDGNTRTSNLQSIIKNFISSVINDSIIDELLKKSKKELTFFINFYGEEFVSAIVRSPEIFDKVHNLLPGDIINKSIVGLINSKPQVVPEKLKIIKYKVVDPVSVVSLLLDKLQGLDVNTKEEYLKIIDKMECAKDDSLIEKFYNFLLTFKSQNPELVKKFSKGRYFKINQRKSLLGDNLEKE